MNTKFESGKTYSTRSACDHNCVFSYEVVKRTTKTVTLKDNYGKQTRRGVKERNGIEFCYPEGVYSMCPVLTAERS